MLTHHKTPLPNARCHELITRSSTWLLLLNLDRSSMKTTTPTQSTQTAPSRVNLKQSTASRRFAFCVLLLPSALTDSYQILAERKSDQGTPLYLVKWEGYELHRSTWEPREHFVDVDCVVNWKLHKREIDAGHAKPFKVATYEAALRRDEEQRERRYAKRAEKRRLKKSRGTTPRRRLLTKKELTKKGTARKAPTRDATSTSSSATENSPRKQTTPLFEPSGPSKSIGLKRKRLSSNARSPSPALSVDDVANSQYSIFNEHTESPRKRPSSHSTTVPKRARVDDLSAEKAATKQKSGSSDKGIVHSTTPPMLQQLGAKAANPS